MDYNSFMKTALKIGMVRKKLPFKFCPFFLYNQSKKQMFEKKLVSLLILLVLTISQQTYNPAALQEAIQERIRDVQVPIFLKEPSCEKRRHCCNFHWVFALDESGSMGGSKWADLVNLMTDIRNDLVTVPRQYMSVFEFNHFASPALAIHELDQTFIPASELTFNGGGTNFAAALTKAHEIISGYKYEDTCFVIITDGAAAYPAAEVAALNLLLNQFKILDYEGCVICYHIGPTIPTYYQQLCTDLQAEDIRGADDGIFQTEFYEAFHTLLKAKVGL